MDNIEFRKRDLPLYRLQYFNDNVSIARSEMIRLLGKPNKENKELVINLEMAIDNGDSVILVPFDLKIPLITYAGGLGTMYNFTQCKIYTTNKDFSQQIKVEMEKCIAEMRKPGREP